MAMLPFAFSVHNFISSVGADAGFAAIIGLAVLILLYFAHARETANLREEAALLTQRLQQAEARVAQLSRAAAPAAPQPEPAPVQVPLLPFAPAGVAAPALAAATRVVPLPEPAVPSEAVEPVPEPVEPVPEPVATPVPAMAMAGMAAPALAAATRVVPLPVPAPQPAAGASAPAPQAPAPPPDDDVAKSPGPVVPGPATSAGGNGAAGRPVAPPPRAAEPAFSGKIAASRGASGARQLPPPGMPPPLEPQRRRSRLGRGVVIALVALAAVAVAVVVFALTSIGSNPKTPSVSTTNAPGPSNSSTAAAFKPSSVTVAVLNGTSTYQLAHRIGQKLAAFGYREGTIATAANQTEQTTVVGYVGGANARTRTTDRTGAIHVARALGLRRSAVQPVGQSTLQVACPASTACTANVVVLVGADLANQ